MVNLEKAARMKRVEERAASNLGIAKMPERMRIDLEERRKKEADYKKKPPIDAACTFQPNKGKKKDKNEDMDFKLKFEGL